MEFNFTLIQVLTREHLAGDLILGHLPPTFYKDLVNPDKDVLVKIINVRRKKITQYALYHDINDDIKARLTDEEVILYNTIRNANKQLLEIMEIKHEVSQTN